MPNEPVHPIRAERKELLKILIRRLHEGLDVEEIKEEFREIVGISTEEEIAEVEEELIEEGMPREEVQRLCDIHLAMFRESLEKEKALPPAGHPLRILIEEHGILLRFAAQLTDLVKGVTATEQLQAKVGELSYLAERMKESQSHYEREENVLFPFLEKHGVTQPPMIMWMEHDKIREMKKSLYALVDMTQNPDIQSIGQLVDVASGVADTLSKHFYKENNILFPTALQVLGQDEWKEIRREFDELGYCSFTPEDTRVAFGAPEATQVAYAAGTIQLGPGSLSTEQAEAVFDALPVDITFIDENDTVRYFNQPRERIFVRTKAVIGRKVQQCHPKKSLHLVNQILDEFKAGRRDIAEFWINSNGRTIHIRFFPVRAKNGNYLGCLEAVQDITEIKKTEGEKRLLETQHI